MHRRSEGVGFPEPDAGAFPVEATATFTPGAAVANDVDDLRADDAGFLSVVRLLVAFALVALVLVGAVAWSTDAPLEAKVVDKKCTGPLGEDTVTVKAKLIPFKHTVKVPGETCAVVDVGNFVEYHFRSKRTVLYESEGGPCLYDSAKGPGCGGASATGL